MENPKKIQTPDEWISPVNYADKAFFAKALGEGFTEAAFGTGGLIERPWTSPRRIAGVWALFHTDGRALAFVHPQSASGATQRPYKMEFTSEEGLRSYMYDEKVLLGTKTNLESLLDMWSEPIVVQ